MNQRLIVAAMEPRTATASYDPANDLYTLRCGSQGVAQVRNQVMGSLRVKPDKLRVLTDDVGGGFGMKASSYPEYVALLCAARKVGRPVHWTASRAESFLSDNQGRDSYWKVELALDRHGRFLALRVDGTANVGAFVTSVAHFCSTTHISGCLPSVYDIPKMYIHTRCVLTNTLPIGAYRGAGRPEANYLLERVIDEAARMTGLDRAEIRRRNLIPPDRVPYHTAFGGTYDSGEFPAMFEKAIKLADYQGFAARRERSEKAGKLRGIGVACFLEIAGAYPEEAATIAFPGGSRVDIGMGAGPSGQGHITVFRRLAAERLGIPESAITILHGDSLRDPPGFGVVASRSAAMVGGAIVTVVDEMLAKARATAALLLQANEEAVEYDAGAFHVPGSGRAVSIFEVAEHAKDLVRQGVIPETLDTKGVLKAPSTYPNGCHVAEVEIDPDTGALTVESYVSVDDCGRVLDPVIVAGQMHGGIAQGLGQALLEDAVYAPNGQLLSASFMDYALPRADVMPAKFMTEHHEVACRTNPLGVKGTGEAGTTAAPCVLMNAVADALPPEAAIGMPATPQKIWQALRDARRR
jgi:carbon-monoxide dehydrogenase large subunit